MMNSHEPTAKLNRRAFLASSTALGATALIPACAPTREMRSDIKRQTLDGMNGFVATGWGPVADVFRANLKEGRDLGAACCVYVDGRPVVDLWGGLIDSKTKRPWARNTVVGVASTTKGATAMCAHLLVQRGQLDLDAPVARYWPEFGQAGKENIPVRYLLSHQVGLAYVDTPITFEDVVAWDPVIRKLEAQRPNWTPGAHHLYHAQTFGWLVGEVVRRISGKSLGTFFQEEIVRPLKLSSWIGLPESIEPRLAQIEIGPSPYKDASELVADFAKNMSIEPSIAGELIQKVYGPGSAFQKAGAVGNMQEHFFSRAFRAAEIPAGNMITDAHSLARMYASTVSEVDGFRLLQPKTVTQMTEVQTDRSSMFGVPPELLPYTKNLFKMSLGFMLSSVPVIPLFGPASFGHSGNGGSIGAGDPESRVGFGYVTNQWPSVLLDTRPIELTNAVRKCLGKA